VRRKNRPRPSILSTYRLSHIMSQDALDLLLSGVKDQAQRKQITSAYYAFSNGDPETFAVQFAVLLRAHATSLKLLPARLEKVLSMEARKLGELVIAHQHSVQRMAALLDEEARGDGVGEGLDRCTTVQRAIEKQLAAHSETLAKAGEKISSSIAANSRLVQKLAGQRNLLIVILSYIGGVFTTLVFEELLALVESMIH
jgi:hypothetical protein